VRVLSREEIEAVELCGDGVPEAGGRERVERVHLVLEAVLVVVNLLEIVYDFYIALNGRLLLARSRSLPDIDLFLPLLLIFALLLVHLL
jgi:hypothetical protein